MTTPVPLADIFPRSTEADWRSVVDRTRRPAAQNVHDSVPERTDSVPLYSRSERAHPIPGRAPGQPWVAVERIGCNGTAETRSLLSEALAGGATGAELAFAESAHPLSGKLPAGSAETVAAALMDTVSVGFHLRIDAPPSAASPFLDVAVAKLAELVLAHDPIATFATHGGAAEAVGAGIAALAEAFAARGVSGAVAIGNGRIWHAGGATDEQELAAVLATFVALLRQSGAIGMIDVALTVDADQFRAIAKCRAMRLLLERVAEVANISARRPRIHAETAWRTMSTRNPEMNILRATSAAFGAAVGGADSITVLPFDALTGGDAHGRRLARNTQAILADEANLYRVGDPAAGSGAIEAMTLTLAEGAWRRFQAIEAEGGIVASIVSGAILRDVANAREARLGQVANGASVMVGVNRYAGDMQPGARSRRPDNNTPLVFKRLAEVFE